MYQQLSQYLFQFKYLNLPGIGSLVLMPKQAVSDFAERSIKAPSWNLLFMPSDISVGIVGNENIHQQNNLYSWLSSQMQAPKNEVVLQFDDFIESLKQKLHEGERVDWESIGTLYKENEQIKFTPTGTLASPLTGVKAEKIIRDNVAHNATVKEEILEVKIEKKELGESSKRTKSPAMWFLLIIGLGLLLLYFIMGGFELSAIGNKGKAEIKQPTETYQSK
ncbi:MAG: hypothetical protein IPH58_18950 [Sphingobacteriales bacterium]|jgi:hypothetical protein|nr:hypothetical protein [Sphingobacteriales bacterium]